jgi:putative phage-type endonuclease
MRVLDLEQGSSAWEQWRRCGIGGSDAPAIMGVGFVSADDLLAEKLGRRERDVTYAMRRGLRLEAEARDLFCRQRGVLVRPACVEREDLPWLRASLDGLDFWGQLVLEVKCPHVIDHEIALAGVVPHHYWPQVQHQLLVTEAPLLCYASYSLAERFGGPEVPSLAVVEVTHDAEYQAALLEAEVTFWVKWQKQLERAA